MGFSRLPTYDLEGHSGYSFGPLFSSPGMFGEREVGDTCLGLWRGKGTWSCYSPAARSLTVTVPSRCQKEGRMFTASPLNMPFLLPSGLPARKGQQRPYGSEPGEVRLTEGPAGSLRGAQGPRTVSCPSHPPNSVLPYLLFPRSLPF